MVKDNTRSLMNGDCVESVRTGRATITEVLGGTEATLSRCINIVSDIEDRLFPSSTDTCCSDPKSTTPVNRSILTELIEINEKAQRIEGFLNRIASGI